ncbi:MAG: hypothetical protein R3F35_02625 [Myxococcota bacterium]
MIFGRGRRRKDVSDFQQALRRSLRAAVEGDSARAQTWLERAVELDSADFDAYQALARVYRDRGEIGRAIRMHQNLLLRTDLVYEERSRARLELARDLEAGGFVDRALACYEALLAERPRDPDVLAAFASLQIEQGDAEGAEASVARLRRLDAERAADLAERIGARWPERGQDRRSGGIVSRFVAGLGGRRRADGAERALRLRLERAADDHPARIELARLLQARGRREAARALLRSGLAQAPRALALHRALGRLVLSDASAGDCVEAYRGLLDALDARDARDALDARDARDAHDGRDEAAGALAGSGAADPAPDESERDVGAPPPDAFSARARRQGKNS